MAVKEGMFYWAREATCYSRAETVRLQTVAQVSEVYNKEAMQRQLVERARWSMAAREALSFKAKAASARHLT